MEKQTFHNKQNIQEARAQHQAKMKQALALVETIQDPMQKSKEYKKLSKIKFQYFKKSQKQIDLENSLNKIQTGLDIVNKETSTVE